MSEYRLTLGNRSIVWGECIDVDGLIKDQHSNGTERTIENGDWKLAEGVYRAKDLVRELSVLITAIQIQVGDTSASEKLLDNLQASLALAGREAVLPLGALTLGDSARIELSAQAQTIGIVLTSWAREFNTEEWALKQYGLTALSKLVFRSRCDNHLWTPEVANILTGPTGSPIVMQIYNEYLHQLVLLREALIPFDNWQEVPIELKVSGSGLRFLEQARTEFLSEFLVKKLSHKALTRFAQSVLSTGLSTVGYGFQYRLGTILPASLGSSVAQASKYLLHWHPASTFASADSGAQASVAFEYSFADYYLAERSQPSEGTTFILKADDQELQDVTEAKLVITAGESNHVTIQFQLAIGDTELAVDLGQAFRGHRFMYRPLPFLQASEGFVPSEQTDIKSHNAVDLLGLPGLVSNDTGIHFISSAGNSLVQWALLGKLYPENVIMIDSVDTNELAAARESGKGFGTRFLIH